MVMGSGLLGFDNEGGIIVNNRQYRRRKVQIEVTDENLPKKSKRKKIAKKNYLNKRKK